MATINADYITLTAVIGAAIGDTATDVDTDPDWVTATEGTVTFTPNIESVNATNSDGKTVRVVPFPIVCAIDAQGRLTFNGDPSVTLMDLGSSKVNPSIPRDKAAYNVTFSGVKMSAATVKMSGFGINPDPADAVAGSINLWDIAPLPTGTGGAAIVRGTGLPSITTATAGDTVYYDGTDITWADPSGAGLVAATTVGQPGGVASLDDAGLVPVGQVPDLSGTYVSVSQIGADSGVAAINSAGYVTDGSGAEVVSAGPLSVMAAAFGVKGDGTTDDAAALNTALTSASSSGHTLTLAPSSTVLVSSASIAVPSGTKLNLNGATIRSGLTGSSPLIAINDASDVVIFGGVLDGGTDGMGSGTSLRHGVTVAGSDSVTLRDLTVKNNNGDGVYVGDQNGASSAVTLDAVTCTGNYRNAMSVTHVTGLVATGCVFENTSGSSPQSGVDVEPNVTTVPCNDIRFIGCRFTGNSAHGLLVSLQQSPTAAQGDVSLLGCLVESNGSNGILLRAAKNVRILGSTISKNTNAGIAAASDPCANIIIGSCSLVGNGTQGINLLTAFTNVTVAGTVVLDNSTTTSGSAMGIDAVPNAASTGLQIVGCVSGGASQHAGLRTNAQLSYVTLVGNSYPGNESYPQTLSDDVTTRTQIESVAAALPSGMTVLGKIGLTRGSGTTMLGVASTGDTVDRLALRTDGLINFSSGSAAADAHLSRLAAGVVGVAASECIRSGVGATASRPSASAAGAGSQWFDIDLGKPIWSDGVDWRDAAGTVV